MNEEQESFELSASEAGRRTTPREGQFITATDTRLRAERHVANRVFKEFKDAIVRDGADARLRVYIHSDRTGKDVWVVYKNPDGYALKSSEIVVVCKRTGRVLYEGSACDEG